MLGAFDLTQNLHSQPAQVVWDSSHFQIFSRLKITDVYGVEAERILSITPPDFCVCE